MPAVMLVSLLVIAGIAVFHVVHHVLYCRYRMVPEKSHCRVCGHRRICQKVHHRKLPPR